MSTLGGVRGGNREEPPYSIYWLIVYVDQPAPRSRESLPT